MLKKKKNDVFNHIYIFFFSAVRCRRQHQEHRAGSQESRGELRRGRYRQPRGFDQTFGPGKLVILSWGFAPLPERRAKLECHRIRCAQATSGPKIPKELMALRAANLEWSCFHVDSTSMFRKAGCRFYNSRWYDVPVLMSITGGRVELNNVLNNHFTLTKLAEFVTHVEKEFSPGAENEKGECLATPPLQDV